ncbi:MAG: hypothetical protein Tsb0020_17130 [Haliangiales bacterium]
MWTLLALSSLIVSAGCGGGGDGGDSGGAPPAPNLPGVIDPSVNFHDIDVPVEHPRLWWNQDTLAAAKAWHEAVGWAPHPKTELNINDGQIAVDNAMMYLFTREPAYARRAIAWAKMTLGEMESADFEGGEGTCNQCRWYARRTMLIIDWCHDELSDSEIDRFYGSFNDFIPRWNTASWGNPEQVNSNFNHGYMVQSFLWGLMIYHENRDLAVELLSHAYDQRWAHFRDYARGPGSGGIPSEGTSYNQALLSYHIEAAESMRNVGVDYYGETDFFAKAIIFDIYNTVPQPVYLSADEESAYWSIFPYGDSGSYMYISEWSEVINDSYAKFHLWAAHRWRDQGMLARYARGWVDALSLLDANIAPPAFVRALSESLPGADMRTLPLDYFAPGGGYVPYGYARTSWDSDAVALSVQLGKPPLGGHEHDDAGTFSLVRGARWLLMAVPGRGYGSGWQVPNYDRSGASDVQHTIAKNSMLFGGEGQNGRSHTSGNVMRLESQPSYFYAANDLTPAYRSAADLGPVNDNVEHFEREFLFVRPLETLLIFDRTESRAGADQRKTMLLHTQAAPISEGGGRYRATNVDQEAVISLLLPSADVSPGLSVDVVDESGYGESRRDRPYRLQVESSAEGVVYFLSAIHAKATGDADISVRVDDLGDSYEVTLAHPSRGSAVVRFEKGITSVGGSFGYSASGAPALAPLRADAQEVRVTVEEGPVWVR